jgi:hypothetical protein
LTSFFDCSSQFRQQILWNKFYIRCAYFTPYCTWSPNYSVLVNLSHCTSLRQARAACVDMSMTI